MKNCLRTIVSLLLVSLFALPVIGAARDADGRLDINKATAAELTELPRVGPAVAARIIAYREQNGGFRTVDELMQVRGIGQRTFDGLREQVSVAPADESPGDNEPAVSQEAKVNK